MREVTVKYKDGKPPTIRIERSGEHGGCVFCPARSALTRHHVFGSGDPLTMRLCQNCHHMIHQELNVGKLGPFCRHAFKLLSQLFPVRGKLPIDAPNQ